MSYDNSIIKSSMYNVICSGLVNSRCSYFIDNNRNVFVCGENNEGKLGYEENIIYPVKQINSLHSVKLIDYGITHTVCLNFEGDIFTLGKNKEGVLGINNTDISYHTHIPQKLDIEPIQHISCGTHFTFCLSFSGKLFIFGRFDSITYFKPEEFPFNDTIDFIECGSNFIICRTINNSFYSCGSNGFGQISLPNNKYYSKLTKITNFPDNIISIKCGYEHTLLLTNEGIVYTLGVDSHGSIGRNIKDSPNNIPTILPNLPDITKIECGHRHNILLDINNNIWVFGWNNFGQLGLGNESDINIPTLNKNINDVIDISHGGNQTFIKTLHNKIYAFGKNNSNQLGIKTNIMHQLTPIQVLKDNEDIWGINCSNSRQKSARK